MTHLHADPHSAAEQTAIDAKNRFEALEANARQELAETIAAEKKDSSNAVESKAYIAAQLADSKADSKAADSQLPETTRLANKISQISPQVQGLWNEYAVKPQKTQPPKIQRSERWCRVSGMSTLLKPNTPSNPKNSIWNDLGCPASNILVLSSARVKCHYR